MVETNFKQTEIGLIPCDWDSKPIESSFSFIGNNTFSRDQLEENGDVYNIHYGDILVKYGAVVDLRKDNVPRIKKDLRTIAKNALQNGDVLMADTAEDEIVGKCCEIAGVEDNQVETGLHTFGLRPKDEYAPSFLGYAFNSSIYHNQLLPHIQGTKVSSISKSAVEKTFLCSPKSLEEQYRIVEALSDMDKLLAALEKKIAKKQAIKQGAMQQLLTGKKRLPGFTDDWKEVKVKDIFQITRGYVLPVKEMSSFCNSYVPYPVYSSQTANGGITGYYRDFLFSDSITWTTDGANAGDVNYRSGKFYCTNVCGVLISKEGYANLCIAEIINSVSGNYVSYVGNPKLMNNVMAEIEIRIPSTFEEQKAISIVLLSMNEEIEQLQQKLMKYKSLKQGMMQKLLTGQIRLI